MVPSLTRLLVEWRQLHERDNEMTDGFGNARKQAALERITRGEVAQHVYHWSHQLLPLTECSTSNPVVAACRRCSASKVSRISHSIKLGSRANDCSFTVLQVKCNGDQLACESCLTSGKECDYSDEGGLVAVPTRARSQSTTASSVTPMDRNTPSAHE